LEPLGRSFNVANGQLALGVSAAGGSAIGIVKNEDRSIWLILLNPQLAAM
jgi:hypothetical protein